MTSLTAKLLALLVLGTVLLPSQAQTPPPKPLSVSVVPYLSARAMVTAYEPMRVYLEQALGRPVQIFSPPGFKSFVLTAQQGEYDLVISAAHVARMLETQQKMQPLVRFSTPGQAVVVGLPGSTVRTAQDLKGKVVAIPSQLSLASIVSMTYVTDSGLVEGKDFQVLESPSFSAAVAAVQKGDAAVAFSSVVALDQMAPDQRDSIRRVISSGDFFNPVFMAHPALGPATMAQITTALLKFGDTSAGQQFLRSSGFGRIIPATKKDMATLDRYTALTQKLLEKSP